MTTHDLTSLSNRLSDNLEGAVEKNTLKSIDGLISKYSEDFKKNSDGSLKKNSDLFILIKNKLSKLSEFQDDINNKLIGEDDMTPDTALAMGTKIIIVGGTLLAIGIAVALIVHAKSKKQTNNENNDSKKNDNLSATGKDKVKPLSATVMAAGRVVTDNIGLTTERKNVPPPLDYQSHHLLLIMPANHTSELINTKEINNTQVNKLISNAARIYCYSASSPEGNKIAEGVKCNDDPIDFTVASRIFVHLRLLADKSITEQRNTLNVIAKIKPNSTIEVMKEIARLQSAITTKDFYEI